MHFFFLFLLFSFWNEEMFVLFSFNFARILETYFQVVKVASVWYCFFFLMHNRVFPCILNSFDTLTLGSYKIYFILIYSSPNDCCLYVRNDIISSQRHNLESAEFSIIWQRLQYHSLIKLICSVYLSPISSKFLRLYDF